MIARINDDFKNLECLMNLKSHFLHSHLDNFPEYLESEEQDESLYQDKIVMET